MVAQIASMEKAARTDAGMPRKLVIGALVLGTAYIVWRVGTLGSSARLALSVPLLLVEIWALLDLAAFGLRAWRLENDVDPVVDGAARADVVIDASAGGVDELERTLVAVESLRGAATVSVIEPRARRDIVALAGSFGARVQVVEPVEEPVSQITPGGDSDLWLWLSSGQVPFPELIRSVAPRFQEPDVAVCQVAVDLLNADSLVHLRGGRDEDAVRRTVVGPATSRLGLAPWTGAGSLVRRAAIDDVGGIVGVAKDAPLRTAVCLHAAGWTTKWERRPLVRENAPDSLNDYLARRHGQAAAMLRLLRSAQSPLWVRGLTLRARLVHLAAGMPFGRGLRQATAAAILIAVLLTGTMPFVGGTADILVRAGVVAGAVLVARRSLTRGAMGFGDDVRNAWRTLEADAQAFEVENYRPRHELRSVDRHAGLHLLGRLRAVTSMAVALQFAVIAQGVSTLTNGLLPRLSAADQLVAIGFVVGFTIPLVDVLQVVVRRRQRRRHPRLPAALDIELDGSGARTVDLSPKGVGVVMDHAPTMGSVVPYRLALPRADGSTHVVEGRAATRAATADPSGRVRVGLEFLGQSADARSALIRYCAIDHALLHSHSNGEHDPRGLAVSRGQRAQRSMRILMAVSVPAAMVTLMANPSTAQQGLPTVVEAVCVASSTGEPVGDVPVAVAASGQLAADATLIGATGVDGCVASGFDPVLAVAWVGEEHLSTSTPARYDGASMVFVAEPLAVQVLGPDGRAVVGVEVRGYGAEWEVLGRTDATGTVHYESLGRPTSVDASWDAVRIVADVDEAVERLRASVIEQDPANPVEAVSADAGWIPFRAGDPIAAGRTAFRLADGTVLRAEIAPGTSYDLRSGTSRPIEPIIPAPELGSPVPVPTSTALVAVSTSMTSTTSSTVVPTSTTTTPTTTVSTSTTAAPDDAEAVVDTQGEDQ